MSNNYKGQNITTLDLARELKRLLDKKKTSIEVGIEDATLLNNEDGSSVSIKFSAKPGRETRVSYR